MTDIANIIDGIYLYLKKQNQLNLLPDIIKGLAQLANTQQVTVESAVQLTDTEKVQIKSLLSKKFSPPVNIIFSLNPSLIGGLKISAPGKELDLSVLGRLEEYEN